MGVNAVYGRFHGRNPGSSSHPLIETEVEPIEMPGYRVAPHSGAWIEEAKIKSIK